MVAAVKTAAESLELRIVVPFYNEAENIEPCTCVFRDRVLSDKSDPDNLSADKEKPTPKNIPPRLCGG